MQLTFRATWDHYANAIGYILTARRAEDCLPNEFLWRTTQRNQATVTGVLQNFDDVQGSTFVFDLRVINKIVGLDRRPIAPQLRKHVKGKVETLQQII